MLSPSKNHRQVSLQNNVLVLLQSIVHQHAPYHQPPQWVITHSPQCRGSIQPYQLIIISKRTLSHPSRRIEVSFSLFSLSI